MVYSIIIRCGAKVMVSLPSGVGRSENEEASGWFSGSCQCFDLFSVSPVWVPGL